jgi:hypothetical protein
MVECRRSRFTISGLLKNICSHSPVVTSCLSQFFVIFPLSHSKPVQFANILIGLVIISVYHDYIHMVNRDEQNAEFSKRDSMSRATHGAFAYVPWLFASAAMPGSRKRYISYNETALHQKYNFSLKIIFSYSSRIKEIAPLPCSPPTNRNSIHHPNQQISKKHIKLRPKQPTT